MFEGEYRNIKISPESMSKAMARGMWAKEQSEAVVKLEKLSARFENIHPDDIRGILGAVSQAKRYTPKDFLVEEKRMIVIRKTQEILARQVVRIKASGQTLPKLRPLGETALGQSYD